jgi:Zn-dependent hydrolases, including glyoxylases
MNITDHIIFIEGTDKGRYPYSNSLLVKDETTALIDAGAGEEMMHKLVTSEKIDLLINSHCHEDHIAYDNLFRSKVCIHKLEAPVLRSVKKLIELHCEEGSLIEEEMTIFIQNFINFDGIDVDLEFEDGYIFDLGDTQLKVIHTPGHSKGHSCFFDEKEKILFSADIDLTSFGPWYGAIDSDIDDFIVSIKRIRRLRPEIIISSHKGVIKEDIGAKLDIYLEKIYAREEKILDFLQKKRTLKEITKESIIYGDGKIPEFLRWLYEPMERIMIEKHLGRLFKRGDVRRVDDRFSIV